MIKHNIIFTGLFCMFFTSFCLSAVAATYTVEQDVYCCLCTNDSCGECSDDCSSDCEEKEMFGVTWKVGNKNPSTKIELGNDEFEKVKQLSCYGDKLEKLIIPKGEKREIDPNSPLYKAVISKTVKPDGLCVSTLGEKNNFEKDGDCTYVSPDFGICDTHAYNAGELTNPEGSADRDFIRDVVGLKVTVISQQMYKQYEYLSATLKRLKTQLEKSVLNAKLEMAGAHSESSSGGSSSGGYKTYLAGADNCNTKGSKDSAYSCLQSNTSLILTAASNNTKQACNQFADTYNAAKTWEVLNDQNGNAQDLKVGTSNFECKDIKNKCNKNNLIDCAQALNVKIINKRDDLTKSQGRGLYIGGL